jgi:hypothetical protein
METTKALLKIYKMLGLNFSTQKFASLKLKDKNIEITNNMDEEMELGQEIYVVGDGSELSPAPSGKHILEDGRVIELDEKSILRVISMAEKMEDAAEDQLINERIGDSENEVETLEEEMTEAKDAKGQILESKTFDVGEEVYVVDGDDKKLAPDGEHQVVLRDTSGNENKIRIMTKDGVITQRENVEEMTQEMSEMDMMKEEMAVMKMAIQEMLGYLKNKDEEMSKQVASVRQDFEAFKKSPVHTPIQESKNVKQTFEDWRYAQLKKLK